MFDNFDDSSAMDYPSCSEDENAYEDDRRGQAVNNKSLTLCSRDLNLSPTYVRDWEGRHAYREILQNQLVAVYCLSSSY
jgi:hypothetical protein